MILADSHSQDLFIEHFGSIYCVEHKTATTRPNP